MGAGGFASGGERVGRESRRNPSLPRTEIVFLMPPWAAALRQDLHPLPHRR